MRIRTTIRATDSPKRSRSATGVFGLLIAVLSVLLTACSSTASAAVPTSTPGEGVTAITPPIVLPDFTLTSTQNTPFGLNDLKGKVSIITFGYTHCPDVCPINLANFRVVKGLLGADAARVQFIFISVDGTRDTPDVLAKHLALFDPSFIGLTGADTVIAPVAKAFYVTYFLSPPDAYGNYTVTHTASWFLVDAQGHLSRIYDYGTDPKIIAADVESVLQS